MFFESLRSEGLAHFSYILGDAGQAAVVDPRRDVDAYLEIAQRNGSRITHVFETHRNEDYVVGSCELARLAGAEIFHGKNLDFGYGRAVQEGDTFEFGKVRLKVLETPGHTDESVSLVLFDLDSSEDPLAVFTGDALFVGDVGRTDFYPERAREVAGLLYDSIFDKLLPLGDHVLLYPAHGAGSVCGSGMAERDCSTLGYERRNNPALQLGREDFVARKLAERHYQPPYFREMERRNLAGTPALERLPRPAPLSPEAFAARMQDGMAALDVRSPEAIAGAMIPGSLGLPRDMISGFAGWYLEYGTPIGLIGAGQEHLDEVMRQLVRLGYERIDALLDEGLHRWETSGRAYQTIPALHAADLKAWIDTGKAFTLLDVRGADEVANGVLPGAMHIYVGELERRIGDVPSGRPVVTFCGSGKRAIIAATLLKRAGFAEVIVCLGSMAACRAIGCETVPLDAAT